MHEIYSRLWSILTELSSTGGSPPFKPDDFTQRNTNEPYIDFLNFILHQSSIAQVLSTSYGDDEQSVRLARFKSILTSNVTYHPGTTRLCSESLQYVRSTWISWNDSGLLYWRLRVISLIITFRRTLKLDL